MWISHFMMENLDKTMDALTAAMLASTMKMADFKPEKIPSANFDMLKTACLNQSESAKPVNQRDWQLHCSSFVLMRHFNQSECGKAKRMH